VAFTQDGRLGQAGVWLFYPAVAVDAANNAVIALSRSSASQFVSAAWAVHAAADAAGVTQAPVQFKAGAARYQRTDAEGVNRWGDYLGAAVDPADGTFWVVGAYAATSTTWGTWVSNLRVGTPLAVTSIGTTRLPPHPVDTAVRFTAGVTGGRSPLQFKWRLHDGARWTVLRNWSTSPDLSWTPHETSDDYRIALWARSAASTADGPDSDRAATVVDFPVTVPAQIRFLNTAILCPPAGCTGFTARLTTKQGPAWTSFTSAVSPYQNVTAALLNGFRIDFVGWALPAQEVPGIFAPTAGRRYLIQYTGSGLQFVAEGAVPR
jgi:hypothetical protein